MGNDLKKAGVSPASNQVSLDTYNHLWSIADKNNNNHLDKEEALKFLKRYCKAAKIDYSREKAEKVLEFCGGGPNGVNGLDRAQFAFVIQTENERVNKLVSQSLAQLAAPEAALAKAKLAVYQGAVPLGKSYDILAKQASKSAMLFGELASAYTFAGDAQKSILCKNAMDTQRLWAEQSAENARQLRLLAVELGLEQAAYDVLPAEERGLPLFPDKKHVVVTPAPAAHEAAVTVQTGETVVATTTVVETHKHKHGLFHRDREVALDNTAAQAAAQTAADTAAAAAAQTAAATAAAHGTVPVAAPPLGAGTPVAVGAPGVHHVAGAPVAVGAPGVHHVAGAPGAVPVATNPVTGVAHTSATPAVAQQVAQAQEAATKAAALHAADKAPKHASGTTTTTGTTVVGAPIVVGERTAATTTTVPTHH